MTNSKTDNRITDEDVIISAFVPGSCFDEEEIAFLEERSRLADEDEKAGRLIPADIAIKNLRRRIAQRKAQN